MIYEFPNEPLQKGLQKQHLVLQNLHNLCHCLKAKKNTQAHTFLLLYMGRTNAVSSSKKEKPTLVY